MQRLVYGADADVMPTLMLIAHSTGGKRVMHARGVVEKCNASSPGSTSGKSDDLSAQSGV